MVEHTVPPNLQYYNTTSYAHMELMVYHNYLVYMCILYRHNVLREDFFFFFCHFMLSLESEFCSDSNGNRL